MIHDEVKNPFPGLRPFEFGDNHLFFGRDQQTTELTTRLRKNRFVAVVGTSGSGKSSLVRAGLMPELLSGTMAGVGSSWETTVMRPGGDPLTNLANAIVEADLYDSDEEDIASQVRATLTRSGLGLVEAMRQSELPEGTNFLLVVDQFEEIFRFRRSDDATDEQAAFFVNLLLEASAQADLPLYVIITMRSDFLGECSQFPRLADTVNEGEFLIPRLNRDQRKEAIVGPVKVAGGEIADRLLLRLLNDIGDDPDQLPILQHALMRTWDLFKERGGGGALDLEHYQATGGMGEALSRHADEVYGELPDAEHKRIAEKLFKSLTEKVDANRGIRRPMQLAELHEICGGEESHLREVLDAFRKTGCTFLMPAGEAKIKTKTVIDISHESLMRAWRSLRNWVDEEAQSAKIYRRLADTATLYHEDKAGLYRDPDLQISLSWREASRPNKTWANRYYPGFESAMAFLDQSQEEANREEREREEARQHEVTQAKALAKARARSVRIFKFACVGVSILAITAIVAMIDATVSRDAAEKAILDQAKRSEETSARYIAEKKFSYAVPWLVDAISLSDADLEQKNKRNKQLIELLIKSIKFVGHERINGKIQQVKENNNSNGLAVLTDSKLLNLDKNLKISESVSLYDKFYKAINFSDDNKCVFGISKDKKFIIYNITDDNIVYKSTFEKAVLDASISTLFSADSKYFVFATMGNPDRLVVVNVLNSEFLTVDLDHPITHISFDGSSNNSELTFITNDSINNKSIFHRIPLSEEMTLNLMENKEIKMLGSITHLAYINNTPYYSFNRIDGVSLIKNVSFKNDSNGNKEIVLPKSIKTFEFLPEMSKFIYLNLDRSLSIAGTILNKGSDLSQSTTINIESEENILAYKISPDYSYLATINSRNSIEFWDFNSGERIFNNIINNSPIKNISISPNTKDIFLTDYQGIIRKLILPAFVSKRNAYLQGYYETISVNIKNSTPYRNYKIYFPERRGSVNKVFNGYQISELELIDSTGKDATDINTTIRSTHSKIKWGQSGSPLAEEADKAIDNDYITKHFNFSNSEEAGLLIDLKEPIAISGFRITSANDIPHRHPISYKLFGSNDGSAYELISSGEILNENFVKQNKLLETKINNNTTDLEKSNLTQYLLGASLSSSGTIVPTNYNKEIKNIDNINIALEKLGNNHYFNYNKLNKSILINDSYGILYHYDYLSKLGLNLDNLKRVGGMAYTQFEDFDNAVENYKSAIKINEKDWESKIDLAAIYLKLDKLNEFRVTLESIVDSDLYGNSDILIFRSSNLIAHSPVKIKTSTIDKAINQAFKSANVTKYKDRNGALQLNEFINDFSSGGKSLSIEKTSNGFITINNFELNLVKGFTVEGWIKKGDGFGWILNYGSEGWGSDIRDGFSVLQLGGSTIRFELSNASKLEKLAQDVLIPEGSEWFHYAATWNSKTSEVHSYINGNLILDPSNVYSGKASQGINGNFYGPVKLPNRKINFARTSLGWPMRWGGGLSEVRLWNYPRNAKEISDSKNSRLEGDDPGLVGYWKLNDNDSNLISGISNQVSGTYNNPNWQETEELPFSDSDKYPLFKAREISDNNEQNINWIVFLETYSKLQMLKGNHEQGIKMLDMARFETANPPLATDEKYFELGNAWQLISLANAYIEINKNETAKKLIKRIKTLDPINANGFDVNGIVYEAIEKKVMNSINSL